MREQAACWEGAYEELSAGPHLPKEVEPAAACPSDDRCTNIQDGGSAVAGFQRLLDKAEQIFVRTVRGKTVAVEAMLMDMVGNLMCQLEEIEGIPWDYQRLLFEGKQLAKERPLNDYGVCQGSTLSMLLPLRGGGLCSSRECCSRDAERLQAMREKSEEEAADDMDLVEAQHAATASSSSSDSPASPRGHEGGRSAEKPTAAERAMRERPSPEGAEQPSSPWKDWWIKGTMPCCARDSERLQAMREKQEEEEADLMGDYPTSEEDGSEPGAWRQEKDDLSTNNTWTHEDQEQAEAWVKRLEEASQQCQVEERQKKLDEELREAAEHGKLVRTQVLLDKRADINGKDFLHLTALHKAAEFGHAEVLQALLVNRVNIHAFDRSGETALHMAAERGHKQCVEVLLEHQSSIDATNNAGRTALHFASREGRAQVVSALLHFQADLDARDINNETALDRADVFGHQEVVTILETHKEIKVPLQVHAKEEESGRLEITCTSLGGNTVAQFADVDPKDSYASLAARIKGQLRPPLGAYCWQLIVAMECLDDSEAPDRTLSELFSLA